MLPQENARLTLVEVPGTSEAYDDAEASLSGTELWSGSLSAYYMERRERVAGAGSESLLVRRSVLVERDRPPGVQWDSGMAVRLVHAGREVRGTVQHVELRALAGLGGAQATRLTLEDA